MDLLLESLRARKKMEHHGIKGTRSVLKGNLGVLCDESEAPWGAGARHEVREGELLGTGNRSLAHGDNWGSTGPSGETVLAAAPMSAWVTRLSINSQCGGAGKTIGGGDNHRGFLIDE